MRGDMIETYKYLHGLYNCNNDNHVHLYAFPIMLNAFTLKQSLEILWKNEQSRPYSNIRINRKQMIKLLKNSKNQNKTYKKVND